MFRSIRTNLVYAFGFGSMNSQAIIEFWSPVVNVYAIARLIQKKVDFELEGIQTALSVFS